MYKRTNVEEGHGDFCCFIHYPRFVVPLNLKTCFTRSEILKNLDILFNYSENMGLEFSQLLVLFGHLKMSYQLKLFLEHFCMYSKASQKNIFFEMNLHADLVPAT